MGYRYALEYRTPLCSTSSNRKASSRSGPLRDSSALTPYLWINTELCTQPKTLQPILPYWASIVCLLFYSFCGPDYPYRPKLQTFLLTNAVVIFIKSVCLVRVIHKRCLLKRGGRVSETTSPLGVIKPKAMKDDKGSESRGVIKLEKWADVVYMDELLDRMQSWPQIS